MLNERETLVMKKKKQNIICYSLPGRMKYKELVIPGDL